MGEKSLKITLKKSPIGRPESHKRTVKALGLRKLNQTVYHKDSSSLRGMVNKISYLLEVEEVESAEEGER
ncbi:MAG: 50S ribosomal protein L30 [Atribacterota bacterium]|jgi:large subunit ribosomal protein L30|nr:50S ribosomal protein L30 [Atribacterota bacterium]